MTQTSWYGYAFAAMICMGLQRFLYKVSAERRCNTARTTFAFMSTVAVLSVAILMVRRPPLERPALLLTIAAVNSASFLVGTITHMEALKWIPVVAAYTIIRLNVAVVVVFSILVFGDRLSLNQAIGIVLAIAVILLLTRRSAGNEALRPHAPKGYALAFFSLLAGAVASVSSKYAAMYVDRLAFMAASYTLSALLSLAIRNRLASDFDRASGKTALSIGAVMGLINFAGYYAFLMALSLGPMSLVVPITGLHFIIAVLLAALIYHEKLTVTGILAVFLAALTLFLLRT